MESTALVPYEDAVLTRNPKPQLMWHTYFGDVAEDGFFIRNYSYYRFVFVAYGTLGDTVYGIIGRTQEVIEYINEHGLAGVVYGGIFNDVEGFDTINSMLAYIDQFRDMFFDSELGVVNLFTQEFVSRYFTMDLGNATEYVMREGATLSYE